jgi:biotin--protein ligase
MTILVLFFYVLALDIRSEVLIYNGPGTMDVLPLANYLGNILPSYYNIKLVTPQYMSYDTWQSNTALLIIPGGRASPYEEFLNTEAIRKYVYNGGNYLGICAGR